MIVMIDNYDSFTYNLVQRLGEVARQSETTVFRNDQVTIEQIEQLQPQRIIISPGPCTPREAGISNDVIRHFAGKVPLLGVCLGHQCIGYAFGAKVVRAGRLMHGKTSEISHDGRTVFQGVENPFTATRYHSLMVERESLPPEFEVTAETTDQKELMGIRHKDLPIEGLQFHPESFLTDAGYRILENFAKM